MESLRSKMLEKEELNTNTVDAPPKRLDVPDEALNILLSLL